MRWFGWLLLQTAIVCWFISLVDEPELRGAGAVYGTLAALIVTGLLSRLLDWYAARCARVAEHKNAQRQDIGVSRSNRHLSNAPQLSNRRRVGQNIR